MAALSMVEAFVDFGMSEFDAWRWNQYWVELESVVEFKRQVYRLALTELARLLSRPPAPLGYKGYGYPGCDAPEKPGPASAKIEPNDRIF